MAGSSPGQSIAVLFSHESNVSLGVSTLRVFVYDMDVTDIDVGQWDGCICLAASMACPNVSLKCRRSLF